MQTLKLNSPLRTTEPRVQIDGRLAVGLYRVQLVVEGRRGKSDPATLTVRVVKER